MAIRFISGRLLDGTLISGTELEIRAAVREFWKKPSSACDRCEASIHHRKMRAPLIVHQNNCPRLVGDPGGNGTLGVHVKARHAAKHIGFGT